MIWNDIKNFENCRKYRLKIVGSSCGSELRNDIEKNLIKKQVITILEMSLAIIKWSLKKKKLEFF